MLADRDSLLVISAVAWVLLGGRIMGWGGVGGQTEGPLGRETQMNLPGSAVDAQDIVAVGLLVWLSGLSWLFSQVLTKPGQGTA